MPDSQGVLLFDLGLAPRACERSRQDGCNDAASSMRHAMHCSADNFAQKSMSEFPDLFSRKVATAITLCVHANTRRDGLPRIFCKCVEAVKWHPVGESNPSFQVENLAS